MPLPKHRSKWRLYYKVMALSLLIILFMIKNNNAVSISTVLLQKGTSISDKVVMIIVDEMSLKDLEKGTFLNDIKNSSHLAMVSCRQNGKIADDKMKLTIGAGYRMDISYSIDRSEIVQKESELIFPNISVLKQQNTINPYNKYIGYLGSELHKNGKKTGIISNRPDGQVNAYYIPMDNAGRIDYGSLDDGTMSDNTNPDNLKMNYQKLEELYEQYLPACSFFVIDAGSMKKQTLKQTDLFIQDLVKKESNQNITYIITSTFPTADYRNKSIRLTPIVIYKKNGLSGLLYSENTKRAGLVVNTDIADYILQELGLKDTSSIKELSGGYSFEQLSAMSSRIYRNAVLRQPVLKAYAVFIMFSAVSTLLFIIIYLSAKPDKKHAYPWVRYTVFKGIKAMVIACMLSPFILLFSGYIPKLRIYAVLILYFAVMLLTAVLIEYGIKNPYKKFIVVTFLLTAGITADAFTQNMLLKYSVLSYDAGLGARFYGIGNEYAGCFIGSSLLLAGSVLELNKKRRQWHSCLVYFSYFAFCSLIIGAPFFGADFGGILAAIAAYFFSYTIIKNKELKLKVLPTLLALLFFSISAVCIVDGLLMGYSSHIGKLVKDINENGIAVLTTTILRKITMNLKILKATIWTKVILCLIMIIAALFFRPIKLLQRIFKKQIYLTATWIGMLAGAIIGFLVNDSGIIMAATAMIYMCFSMLYLCLEEIMQQNRFETM